MKATASHRAEKQPRTPDQKLPLTGQCAREPACYVRSRRSPGASKIKQTAQSKLAYFYAALMDQFCTALDSEQSERHESVTGPLPGQFSVTINTQNLDVHLMLLSPPMPATVAADWWEGSSSH